MKTYQLTSLPEPLRVLAKTQGDLLTNVGQDPEKMRAKAIEIECNWTKLFDEAKAAKLVPPEADADDYNLRLSKCGGYLALSRMNGPEAFMQAMAEVEKMMRSAGSGLPIPVASRKSEVVH